MLPSSHNQSTRKNSCGKKSSSIQNRQEVRQCGWASWLLKGQLMSSNKNKDTQERIVISAKPGCSIIYACRAPTITWEYWPVDPHSQQPIGHARYSSSLNPQTCLWPQLWIVPMGNITLQPSNTLQYIHIKTFGLSQPYQLYYSPREGSCLLMCFWRASKPSLKFSQYHGIPSLLQTNHHHQSHCSWWKDSHWVHWVLDKTLRAWSWEVLITLLDQALKCLLKTHFCRGI